MRPVITNNVVLVLGAGASSPYGFPLGNELVYEALYPVENDDYGVKFLEGQLLKIDVKEEELKAFRKALEASLTTSIDAFLETRDEFEELGKLIIAYLLMIREDPILLFQHERDPENRETWYGTLFRFMHTPNWSRFAGNKLSIITYNYDRSLEYCLLRVLEATYGLDWSECKKLLFDNIKIIHLHGTLGALPGMGALSRAYSTDTSPEQLTIAKQSINVVHKVDASDSCFQDAHYALQGAKDVVFLGFGYYPMNVERLRLKENCPNAQIWGTCKGFTEAETKQFIRPYIPSLKGRHLVDESVNDFLRNHPDIFVKP